MQCLLRAIVMTALVILLHPAARAQSTAGTADFWPQWRGPAGNGVAPHGDPPLKWSATENIRWKVELPGRGHASPIVWGQRVFVLSAVPADEATPSSPAPGGRDSVGSGQPLRRQRFVVTALDRRNGKVVWQHDAREKLPHEGHHADATFASASPVTDGEVLIAHFGSSGVFGYDLTGQVLWQRDLGEMRTRRGFGEGSSPVLHGETVVINWDHEGDSFIVALDKRSGQPRWRKARDEVTSWSTPLVVEVAGRPQVIVNATRRVCGYDLATGDIIWECGGQTVNTIPSPVYGHGLVIAMSGFRGNTLQAIRVAEARGTVSTPPGLAWSYHDDTPYVPSPLLYDEQLYFLKHNSGILSCFDVRSGQPHFSRQRLEGLDNVYASPVGAAGRVYVTGRNGTTVVLRQGPAFEVLATNELGEGVDASAAIAGRELYLRGQKSLYCIAGQ